MVEQPQSDARVGFCAVLGLPNVGKSTLLNQLLGRRLLAVSNKPQTTRNRILGIVNASPSGDVPMGAQIVFVDTPGVQRGKGALRRFMRDEVSAAAANCDVALVVIDVSDPKQRTPKALADKAQGSLGEALGALAVPIVLALNKIDRLRDKQELLPVLEAFAGDKRYASIIPISAAKGDGLDAIIKDVAARLPVGPKLFPEDMITDRAERFLAADLIREQLFRQLGQELPYATACVVEQWTERPDKNDVVIDALVYVERDSQRRIVIGKGGSRIREVGEKARKAIAELLGCPVHLKLLVKVSRDWSQGDKGLRDMGYES